MRHTQEDGQPLWLIMVHNGNAERVEGHQAEHSPIEGMRLHHAANRDAQHALLATEVGCRAPPSTPDVNPRSGTTL